MTSVFILYNATNADPRCQLQFWTLPESLDDVYSLIGASDIRRARDSSRENIETLIDKVGGVVLYIHGTRYSRLNQRIW